MDLRVCWGVSPLLRHCDTDCTEAQQLRKVWIYGWILLSFLTRLCLMSLTYALRRGADAKVVYLPAFRECLLYDARVCELVDSLKLTLQE